MINFPTTRLLALTIALPIVAACGGGEGAPDEMAAATVSFAEPMDGSSVAGPDVNIALSVTGVEIAAATDTRPGTGHHHIFIDDDVTAESEAIPVDRPNIRHFGTGVTEFALTGLTPGQHRLIAVVADAQHVPLSPLVADTINITVVPPTEAM